MKIERAILRRLKKGMLNPMAFKTHKSLYYRRQWTKDLFQSAIARKDRPHSHEFTSAFISQDFDVADVCMKCGKTREELFEMAASK